MGHKLIRTDFNARIQRVRGGLDPPPPHPPPPGKHKAIGFLSNTGSDQLEITKLPSQHSMLGHGHLNGVSLAGR